LGGLGDFTDKIYKLISNKKLNQKMSENAYLEAKNYSWQKHGEIVLNEIKKFS
jgi:glycosyltransferase involved in cell wall biosynthesis